MHTSENCDDYATQHYFRSSADYTFWDARSTRSGNGYDPESKLC